METSEFWIVEFPTTPYMPEDKPYYQKLYFKNLPSKEEVLEVLSFLHERDSKYPTYLGGWGEGLKLLENAKYWVSPVSTSVRFTYSKFTFIRVNMYEN